MCINPGLSRKSECTNAVRHHASLDYFEMMQLSPSQMIGPRGPRPNGFDEPVHVATVDLKWYSEKL